MEMAELRAATRMVMKKRMATPEESQGEERPILAKM